MTKPVALPGMDGRHPRMRELYDLVHRAAGADVPVMIVGETGTGKELVARALHDLSDARNGEFVDINCAAVPESMFEAELFGARRGAYTGAVKSRRGLLEVADGGTVFLDELCSMPVSLQSKLLRAIEHRQFRRLGESSVVRSNFRLVAAVSKPTRQLISDGSLRDDLAYRLATVEIHVPPLRERGRDIEILAKRFMDEFSVSASLCTCAVQTMRRYSWPGNVRELRSLIQRITFALDVERICEQHLGLAVTPVGLTGDEELLEVLERVNWDIQAAARELGRGRSTVYRQIKERGLRSVVDSHLDESHGILSLSHETRISPRSSL